jgi:prophage tail gpP-like protein
MSSKVIVRAAPAGGGEFQNLVWRKVKVRKSLDEICHSLELELPASERNKIHKHDKVEVRLHSPFVTPDDNADGTKRLTTVMVDEVTDIADTARRGLMVVGRSPARDIIDSSWSGMVLHQQNLEQVANMIANPFLEAVRIKAVDDHKNHVQRMPTTSPETGPVFSFSWSNESPWQKLMAEAANQGYIFTSNEAGNLYLWRVAVNKREEGFSLDEGANIRSIQVTENGAEQFHEYEVRGGGKAPAQQIDATCKNNRKMTINLTDLIISEETLRRRALTEMYRRRDNRTTVTVSGWGLSEGQIQALGSTRQKEIFWNPNFLIPVTIPSMSLDANLLISEAEYQADGASMTSTLTLVNPKAYA